jgi:squalene-hopene/tetraprenyl-beta-curcumene cyclase
VAPGGWAFEFDNDHYPDIDDTALAARALLRVQLPESEERVKREAIDRGLRWILAMQNDNGGWAAFDRENNLKLLTHIPFADFITPLDPDSPDVVAHVLNSGEIGSGKELNRALRYLQRQRSDGAGMAAVSITSTAPRWCWLPTVSADSQTADTAPPPGS